MNDGIPPRLLVMGGININLVAVAERAPQAGETVVGTRFLQYHGGKGANQAVAAARMGAAATLVERVGADAFGRDLLEGLTQRAVDVGSVVVDAEATSGASMITVETGGQNRIIQVPGANHRCGDAELERLNTLLPGSKMLLLTLELPLGVVTAAAAAALAQGVPVMLDPGPAKPLPAELYQHCGVITPNEAEVAALTGIQVNDGTTARQAAQALEALTATGFSPTRMAQSDYALLREFFDRRKRMGSGQGEALARQVASAFATRLEAPIPPKLTPDQYLGALAAAYEARHQYRDMEGA